MNNMLVQDLIYNILIPQFLSLSKPEILEITILYAIQNLTRNTNSKLSVENHFSDYLEINILNPRHVCKFQDVKKAIQDLNLKVSVERQGSFQQEWKRVLKFAIMRLNEQQEPICGFLSGVLDEYVSKYVRNDHSFSINVEIFKNYNELVQRGIVVDTRMKELKNAAKQAKSLFDNDIIIESNDLKVSDLKKERIAQVLLESLIQQKQSNLSRIEQQNKNHQKHQPINHSQDSLLLRKSKSYSKPLQPLDILYEDYSRHQSSSSEELMSCSIKTETNTAKSTTHNSSASEGSVSTSSSDTMIQKTASIVSPKYEQLVSPTNQVEPSLISLVKNDSKPFVQLQRIQDMTSDAEQNVIQISDLAEVFEYQNDQIISEREGEKIEETFEITAE
ncbi:hypothetical protein SS50377_26936 [Spironucleus salmonicida]|uniref:Uncharacterized protein n=1 Tax=Spironucleus salmonicida TaxID=348837 RepID=V6LS10_9EUKA|nr:hypothetical protein SS50377_26936 [Spironucleus salmonicida]|eukprot:EST47447.1 Hypothetical protein SS50377_12433 [Spironucleus salmonicida]